MYKALTLGEAAAQLRRPADTLVLFHARPDADAVGSALALAQLLSALGSRVHCLCADEIPERLHFLVKHLQRDVSLAGIPQDFTAARVVAVDVASPAQLGALWQHFEGKVDLMIDHHATGTPFADHLIDPAASATGELVFALLRELGGELTKKVATLLFAAISSDTGGFRFSNVTPHTHRIAAELLEAGADAAEINHRLFESKSMAMLSAEAAAFSRLHLYADGRVAVITFPHALKAELSLKDEHLATLVDIARSVEGVEVAAAIRQPTPDGEFRVSMRATCDVDVAAICAAFGGGGHKKAAGATLHAADIAAAEKMLTAEILKSIH